MNLTAPGAFSAAGWTFVNWGAGGDLLSFDGSTGTDTITGSALGDFITGGDGRDEIDGGDGDDVFIVDSNDSVFGETLEGGAGVDAIRLASSAATTDLALINNIEHLDFNDRFDVTAVLSGGQIGRAGDITTILSTAGDRVQSLVVHGTGSADQSVDLSAVTFVNWGTAGKTITINGSLFADTLIGSSQRDTLIGGAGNDTLDGGAGIDTLDGGAGDDFYFVDSAADVVVAAAGEGSDRVFAGASFTLGAGAEIEMLTTSNAALTAAIDLTGNNFAQTIVGNAGANRLDGRGEADTMNGLGGDDFYFVDNTGDVVIAATGAGNDRVLTTVDYTLGAGAEIELLTTTNATLTTAIDLTGNEFAQTLIGDAGANVLDGKGGVDIMNGLGGDDLYFVDNLNDIVIAAAGAGNDRVLTSAHHALAAAAEIEMLTTTNVLHTTNLQLTGNNFGQTIIGNAGHNTLAGKGGIDLLNGGAGNDFFVFDTALGAGNVDSIVGYATANDTIRLDDAVFTQILDNGAGFLASFQFIRNASGQAADAADRVIYETDTGNLFYDADGTGATAGIQFATLSAGLAMTHTEFFVI